MDTWSLIIVLLIALIAILLVIETFMQQRKALMRQSLERDKIRNLYAIIYQTKEYIKFVSAIYDNLGKIEKQLQQINEKQLANIYISLLRKSKALAAITCLRAHKTFDFIENDSFTNTAMSNEDRKSIEIILKADYGNDYDSYDIDLYDDSLNSIHEILEAEKNKNK